MSLVKYIHAKTKLNQFFFVVLKTRFKINGTLHLLVQKNFQKFIRQQLQIYKTVFQLWKFEIFDSTLNGCAPGNLILIRLVELWRFSIKFYFLANTSFFVFRFTDSKKIRFAKVTHFSLVITSTVAFDSKCADGNSTVDLESIGAIMPADNPNAWNSGIEQQYLCKMPWKNDYNISFRFFLNQFIK